MTSRSEYRLRARPRWDLRSPLPPEVLRERARVALAEDERIDGLILDDRIELVPAADAQRLWSPQLTARIGPDDGDGSLLDCRFAPHPHVWTMYLAMHGVGAIATLGAAMFGLSQHLAGDSPWALWILPAAPLMALLVWGLAFVGQSLGAEQMYALRRFLEGLLETEES